MSSRLGLAPVPDNMLGRWSLHRGAVGRHHLCTIGSAHSRARVPARRCFSSYHRGQDHEAVSALITRLDAATHTEGNDNIEVVDEAVLQDVADEAIELAGRCVLSPPPATPHHLPSALTHPGPHAASAAVCSRVGDSKPSSCWQNMPSTLSMARRTGASSERFSAAPSAHTMARCRIITWAGEYLRRVVTLRP